MIITYLEHGIFALLVIFGIIRAVKASVQRWTARSSGKDLASEEIIAALKCLVESVGEQNRIISSPDEYAEKIMLSMEKLSVKGDSIAHLADLQLASLDSLNLTLQKFIRTQDRFLATMLGQPMPDEKLDRDGGEVRALAEQLMRRYEGLTPEEAVERAKKTLVYEVGGGTMSGAV